MASRPGEGSLTKMSPLQVTDQMACLEGGPWIPLESQHDALNNASFRPGGRQKERHIRTDWKRQKEGNKNKVVEMCMHFIWVFGKPKGLVCIYLLTSVISVH